VDEIQPKIVSTFSSIGHLASFDNMLERLTIRYLEAMPKKHQGPKDFAEEAFDVFKKAIGEAPPDPDEGKNPAAVALGRLGGRKGGVARKQALSAERRSEIAKKAAETRWKNRKAS